MRWIRKRTVVFDWSFCRLCGTADARANANGGKCHATTCLVCKSRLCAAMTQNDCCAICRYGYVQSHDHYDRICDFPGCTNTAFAKGVNTPTLCLTHLALDPAAEHIKRAVAEREQKWKLIEDGE